MTTETTETTGTHSHMERGRASTGPVAAGLQKPQEPTRTHSHIERGGETPTVASGLQKPQKPQEPTVTWRGAGQAQDR